MCANALPTSAKSAVVRHSPAVGSPSAGSTPSDTIDVLRVECGHRVDADCEVGLVAVARRAERQRQVEVGTRARTFATLVSAADEPRIVLVGVHVDADELHVAALIEDLLRAVAVVGVDVEHGDAPHPGVDQRLRGDRRVVQQAEATERRTGGVMPGRAAQRVDDPLAGQAGDRHPTTRCRPRTELPATSPR